MIKIEGHRGFPDVYPENTKLSFRKAYEAGADGIEMDVRKTGDNVIIISHDATLDRCTNGTGALTSYTFSEIKELDAGSWKGEEFANREDTEIPSLDEILDEFKGENIYLVLHLLIYGENDVKSIVDKVVERNMIPQVRFFSIPSTLNFIKQYNSNVFTQNDGMATIDEYESMLSNAIENNHNSISIRAWETSENIKTMVDNIHSSGKLVHASYVAGDYAKNIEKLNNLGVDFVLGNDVSKMKAALQTNDILKGINKVNSIYLNDGRLVNQIIVIKNGYIIEIKNISRIGRYKIKKLCGKMFHVKHVS